MAESTATRARPRRGALGVLRDGATAADATPYGWAPAVVIFLVGLVDRVEFSLVSAVLPQLQEEWGFGDSVAGSIPTASAVAAGLLALPAGYIADRWDRTRIVAIVVLLWALTTLGSGLVTGFAMFYLLRVLLAAAESIDNPATGSLLADYYPPVTRATAYGWWRTSAYLGGLGLVFGGVLAELFGWRAVFVVMSVPGLVVAWLMWRLQEPERGYVDRLQAAAAPSGDAGVDTAGSTGVSDVTRVGRVPGGGPEADPAVDLADVARVDVPALREQVRAVLRIRTLWFTGFSLTVMSMALAGLYYWMPSLMQRRFDLGEAAAGGISGLVSLVGVVGGTVVGSRLGQRPRGSLGLAPWRVLVGGAGILLNGVLMAGALAMPGVGGVLAARVPLGVLRGVRDPDADGVRRRRHPRPRPRRRVRRPAGGGHGGDGAGPAGRGHRLGGDRLPADRHGVPGAADPRGRRVGAGLPAVGGAGCGGRAERGAELSPVSGEAGQRGMRPVASFTETGTSRAPSPVP